MKSFINIIKYDYLQRTRSYAFLITLCASLAIAYTFIPEPNASYSTIRIADYQGFYNSAWIGYVTAIMTSLFLSLIGFYLVNNSISNDIETKVGQIIASTKITNFKYLFAKVLSNFLILLSILFMIFSMSIILFFIYNDDYSFNLLQFVKPYTIITIPSLFVISVLAVIFEIILGKYSIMQNIAFFFLFNLLLVSAATNETQFSFDLFGSKIVTNQMINEVKTITDTDKLPGLSIGYNIGYGKKINKFNFEGIDFPTSFIISRFLWMLFSIGLIVILSRFFHRFNVKEKKLKKVTKKNTIQKTNKEVILSNLPKAIKNFSIFNILKTELILLFRKGKKWLWLINLIGMALLALVPITIAHQIVLPILWFLQVGRLSELTTKEVTNNVHYFAFTSYKPVSRLLFSQILAGILLVICLSLPLIFRFIFLMDFTTAGTIVLGGIFIVFLASSLGIITKRKKLFEILFFMITYANINRIAVTDYFGAFPHQSNYLIQLIGIVALLGVLSFMFRKYQLKN